MHLFSRPRSSESKALISQKQHCMCVFSSQPALVKTKISFVFCRRLLPFYFASLAALSLVSSPTEEQNTLSYFCQRKFGSSLEHDFERWLKNNWRKWEAEAENTSIINLLLFDYVPSFFAKTSFLMLSPALASPSQAADITSQTVLLEISSYTQTAMTIFPSVWTIATA